MGSAHWFAGGNIVFQHFPLLCPFSKLGLLIPWHRDFELINIQFFSNYLANNPIDNGGL